MSELDKKTKFSIIIPTYNSSKTLLKSLESIRDQHWLNVEVLIIDGNSKDQTVNLAKSFGGLELIIVSEPDKGIYDAVNKGVALASGDLICVIGADDQLAAGALLTIHNAWSIQHTDIVAGSALLESSDGVASKRIDEAYGPNALVSGIPFCHNSMYVTPETYRRVGNYNLNYKICADAEWVHRSIRAGCTCLRLNQVLVHFSLSGTSSTNDELIMSETYASIAANFPGLSVEDAEILFKAVRKWTDDSQVSTVLDKHRSNAALTQAVAAGLCPISETSTTNSIVTYVNVNNSFTAKALRKIQRLLHS